MTYGMRSMRRIRRIALSDTGQSSLNRLMTSQAWDEALASQPHGPSTIVSGPPPKTTMTNAAILSRLFRRRVLQAREGLKGGEPVWINKQADMARARDALRYHEMAAKEAERRAEKYRKHHAHAQSGQVGLGSMGRQDMTSVGDGAKTNLDSRSMCNPSDSTVDMFS